MRTSSPLGDWLRRLLFNKINEQLTSVGTWFFWSFVSFGIWNDFKKYSSTYAESKRIMSNDSL